MHIPDHIVSAPVNALTMVAATVALAYSVRQLGRAPATSSSEEKPTTALMAAVVALIFALQMVNFPIGGGTSGHFLGAAFAAALLGPWGACLAVSLVLLVQGLVFGDGGMTAFGSNILNMGVIGGLLVYPLMQRLRTLLPQGRAGFLIAAGAASWVSIVLASAACAIEIALSGTAPLSTALPAMVSTHALIGVGEAAITVALLAAFASRPRVKTLLASALAIAALLSPLASSFPDGLEKVAEEHGLLSSLGAPVWSYSLFPDYQITALPMEALSTALAGIIGTLLAFALTRAALRLVRQAE